MRLKGLALIALIFISSSSLSFVPSLTRQRHRLGHSHKKNIFRRPKLHNRAATCDPASCHFPCLAFLLQHAVNL